MLLSLRHTLLAFLLPLSLGAQTNTFRWWGIEEGLPQSDVFCIEQDSRGYLWIGTKGGLSRFDGTRFKTYTPKDSMAGMAVRALLFDSRGLLWIGTDAGLNVYNGKKFVHIGSQKKFAGSTVISLMEDSRHRIWAGTDDGGVNLLEVGSNDSVKVVNVINEENGLSSSTIFGIHEDKNHRIWLATYGGINIIALEKDTFAVTRLRRGRDIPGDKILCMEEDNAGTMWFGTYDEGLFSISGDAGSEDRQVMIYDTRQGFRGATIWDILQDAKGDLWFATGDGGIARKRKGSNHFISYTENDGLPGNAYLRLFQDDEGSLWMGGNGGGLVRLTGDRFSHFTEKDGLPENKVMGISQDSSGNYWIVSDGGGIARIFPENGKYGFRHYRTREGLSSNFTTCISTGKGSNPFTWVGAVNGINKFDGHKFTSLDESDGLLSNRVYSILVDSKGIVWVGTAEGISQYDGSRFLNTSSETLLMQDLGVKAIAEDKNDNIWFGTAGGLAKYTRGEKTLTTYDTVEGLSTPDVNAIAVAPDGNIWIATNGGGIFMFDLKNNSKRPVRFVADDSLLSSNSINGLIFLDEFTLLATSSKGFDRIILDKGHRIVKVRSYDASDGFMGVECNDNAIFKDRSGDVWFGTVKGLTRYSPQAEIKHHLPPRIHITGLQLFFKEADWSKRSDTLQSWSLLPLGLSLPHFENHLTFFFTGISLNNPEKVRYQYMLDGLDQDWSPETPDPHITYSGLPHGTYTLKVKAINADGIASPQPATFTFTIRPPWYRTTWFYITAGVTALLLFYAFVKIRERNLRKEKKILEDTVAERTKEIMMQKVQIEQKNHEIMDSINYARGIQDSILPPDEFLEKNALKGFVLYKPKDIVSGDIYWMETVENEEDFSRVYFAAVDCTGHGVPGAFVSIVGSNSLNRTVNEYGITQPSQILDNLSEMVEAAFSKNNRKDGMDMALCCYDKAGRRLEFAGANNPLWIIRKNRQPLAANGKPLEPSMEAGEYKLYEIKADKQPIGAFLEKKNFSNHSIPTLPGDTVYVFSDGYADQFGGPAGKKFKYSRFKELLLSLQEKTMQEQKEYIDRAFETWKGSLEQIDDVCVIGVRL